MILPIQKIDLHAHTVDDPCDRHVWHTAEELIDRAAGQGFTALAITLHTRQFENPRIVEYAAERGILLIPGVEQDVEGCHVLLLNFPSEVANGIRTFEELRQARRPESLIVAAHPFYPNSTCLKQRLFTHRDLFDAVEVSGFYHRYWNPNLKALRAASELGLPVIGNSDTHTLEQFGTQWTEVAAERDSASILAALKRGQGQVRSRPLRWNEMGVITYKVVVRGYFPWIDYRRQRASALR